MKYLIKSIKDFKQYDTRWGGLSYRVLPACVRLNGCGAASVADIIVANPKYKDKTVKYARKWLIDRGYVSANQGTYHSGIPAAMRAHGYTDVKDHKTMSDCFAAMAKDYRAGIILFRSGTRGGRTFTSGGHFCAVAGYKKVDGKHYLYICDPGPRGNDKWICYETQMRGLVSHIWTGIVPGKAKKVKKKKVVKKSKKTKKITVKAKPSENAKKIVKMAKKLAYRTNNKKAKYPNGKPKKAYKKALKEVYPDRSKWGPAPRVGASCDVFVGVTTRASGVDKKFPRGLESQVDYLEKSDKFKRVKPSSVAELVAGDYILYAKPGSGHICIYDGKNIKEASYEYCWPKTTNTAKSRLSKSGKKWVKVYRPI